MSQTNYSPAIYPLQLAASERWAPLTSTTSGSANTATRLLAAYTLATNGFPVIKALLKADASNTAPVTFGPTSAGTTRSISAGEEYELTASPNGEFDLNQYYVKSTGTSQVVSVLCETHYPTPA